MKLAKESGKSMQVDSAMINLSGTLGTSQNLFTWTANSAR